MGINVDVSNAELVWIVEWRQDKIKADWSEYHDRAKANVYVNEYKWNFDDFNFDESEVAWVVLVDAKSTLDLFSKWEWKIQATIIYDDWKENKEIDASEFLVTKDETLLWKYGEVLKKIISLT